MLLLLLAGCAVNDWCQRFNLDCEGEDFDERPYPEDADGDVWVEGEDCDDTRDDVYPGAPEVCDNADNDCDGLVDEDLTGMSTFYTDRDGDGFGDPETEHRACFPSENDVENNSDCDDTDYSISPDAVEVCGGVDHDCDGNICYSCSQADVALYSSEPGARAGYRVFIDTDANGDGNDDLFMQNWDGGLYLQYGPLTGAYYTQGVDVLFERGYENFGNDIDSIDIDGDGFEDVLLGGSDLHYFYGPITGAVDLKTRTVQGDVNLIEVFDSAEGEHQYVAISGGGDVDLFIQGKTFSETAAVIHCDDYGGLSSIGSGDFNADGIGDLLLGAYSSSGWVNGAFLLTGPFGNSPDGSCDFDTRYPGDEDYGRFGDQVDLSGDFNADGYNDVVISEPANNKVRLFWGGIEMPEEEVSPDVTWTGERYSFFGEALTSAPDMNGDHRDELLIGVYQDDRVASSGGAVYLMSDITDGDYTVTDADVWIQPVGAGALLGISVASGGDLNGDAIPDIGVSAMDDPTTGEDAGAAYVFFHIVP